MARINPSLRHYPSTLKDGTTFYLDLSQRMCHGLFLLRGQPHEYGTEKVLQFALHPGDTFVDVGANVGFYSVQAARLVGPTGRVIAIEPQPEALPVLRLNCKQYGEMARVIPAAASDHREKRSFFVRVRGDTSSFQPDKDAQEIAIEADTLDSLCGNLTKVTLIKIDVEGFELEVLRGARSILMKHRPWVHFELLREMVTAGRVNLEDFARYFGELNYSCNWVSHDPGRPLLGAEQSTYLLASPRERLMNHEVLPPAAF